MAFELSPERKAVLDDLLPRYPTKKALTIPLLHLCQEQEGWISPEVTDYVARTLDVTTAHVQGVVTFYTLFMQKKVGRHCIWRLHCGETTKDGEFSLFKTECLAACGQAPMVQLDDAYFENLTLDDVDKLLAETRGKPTPNGTIGFSPLSARREK